MATSIALAAAFIHLALATPLLRRESPASLVPPVLGSLAARSQPHHTTTKHISTAELDCDHPLWSETNIDPCSGHGRCAMTKRGGEDRRCACSPGWRGRRCAQQACLRSCGAHGRCARSGDALACACDVGWSGERCALRQCPVAADGTVCAHHGKCVDGAFATGGSLCFCLAGWTGVDCGKRLCPLGASSSDGELAPCSGRGVCNGDPSEPKCHCLPSFGGAACEIDACAGVNSCSGHGECTGNNECDCAPNWYGESCALPGCPERCNGISHGECIPDSNEPGAGTPRTFHCACREGWAGPSCAVQACPRGCGAGASHGWCRDAVRSAGEETEAGGYALTAPSRANLHAAQVLGAARFCACAPRWAGRGCSKRDGRVQTELHDPGEAYAPVRALWPALAPHSEGKSKSRAMMRSCRGLCVDDCKEHCLAPPRVAFTVDHGKVRLREEAGYTRMPRRACLAACSKRCLVDCFKAMHSAGETGRADAANDPESAGVAGAFYDGTPEGLSPIAAMGGDNDEDVRLARDGGVGE